MAVGGVGVRAVAVSLAAHVLAVASAVMVVVWCIHFRGGLDWNASNKAHIFNIHPVVMLICFIILGGEAIMSYKSLPFEKQTKKLIHMVLHGVALILGIVGIAAAFKYHNQSGILNLYSFHSWLGIAVIVLYALQWIYGFVIFFYPGGSSDLRAVSVPWHALFGLFVFILAVGNAALGFLEKLTFLETSGVAKFGAEAYLVNFTAIATVLYGTFVVLTVFSQAEQSSGGDDFSYAAISSVSVRE